MSTFNNDELKIIGEYSMPGIYGAPDLIVPKYNYPITPKENMIRMLEGKMPLWVPNQDLDNNAIQPLVMPDAKARNFGGTDWFGIEWVYEPNTKAAMVKPGFKRLSDITNWREEIVWPDLSAIDWQKDYEENYKDRIAEDRFSYFVIVNGLFERTADLTSFEDAFCALLEEPEELTAFYDWAPRSAHSSPPICTKNCSCLSTKKSLRQHTTWACISPFTPVDAFPLSCP